MNLDILLRAEQAMWLGFFWCIIQPGMGSWGLDIMGYVLGQFVVIIGDWYDFRRF